MTVPDRDREHVQALAGRTLAAAVERDRELPGMLAEIEAGGPAWVFAAVWGWAGAMLRSLHGQPWPEGMTPDVGRLLFHMGDGDHQSALAMVQAAAARGEAGLLLERMVRLSAEAYRDNVTVWERKGGPGGG